MDSTLDWGIDIILWIRQLIPGFVTVFELFTFMGNEMFFVLLMPFVYWCLDRRTGARLTILFLLSTYSNTAVKLLADQPRPFNYAAESVLPLLKYPLDQAKELYEATGGGFPSGHTQNTVVLWGYLASQFKRTWLWVIAILLMVLIPVSRIYLAVHFPHDLLGGYVLGVTLLFLYIWLEPKATAKLKRSNLTWQLSPALVIPAVLMVLLPNESSITTGATLMGMGTGFVLERRWVGFESAGIWWKRVLRYLVGIIVLLFLYAWLKVAFSGLEPALLLRLVRYGLMGLWGGLGAPWTFVKLGLAQTR